MNNVKDIVLARLLLRSIYKMLSDDVAYGLADIMHQKNLISINPCHDETIASTSRPGAPG